MLDNNNLQIAMLELSDQNRAVLDFYFNSAGRGLYSVVDEAKANAFITDYDFPGAKEHVATILKTNKKPIILLSVKEQDIPFTIWLAKPLSALALTEAADSLKQLIVECAEHSEILEDEVETIEALENDTLIVEPLKSIDAIIEEPAIETSSLEINHKDEIVSESSVASPSFAGDFDLDDVDDVDDENVAAVDNNEVSEESSLETQYVLEDESIDVHKRVEAQLALAGTASLAALAGISSDIAVDSSENSTESNSDVSDDIGTKETTEFEENAHLDLDNVLLDSADDYTIDEEQENEVDALLDSLMSDNQNSDFDVENDVESAIENEVENELDVSAENDVLRDNLASDKELNEQFDSDIPGLSVDSEISLEETQLETIQPEKITSDGLNAFDLLNENSANENIDLEGVPLTEAKIEDLKDESLELDLNLLDESIPLNEEGTVVSEEKESLLLDENFTLHSEQSSSEDDSFVPTLEVDYSDIKADESGKIVNAYVSMESEKVAEEVTDNPSLEEMSFKAKTLNLGVEESLENNMLDFGIEQNELVLEGSEPSINAIEVSEDVLSLSVESKNTSDEEDLDNLLAEVSGVTDGIKESPDELIKVASFAEVVKPKKKNLGDLEQTAEVVEGISEEDSDFNLQSLLNEVRKEAGTSNINSQGIGLGKNSYNQTKAEKRWMHLSGNYDAITTQKEADKITYKLKDHLLGTFLDQIKKVKGSEQLYRLKYYDLIIVIDHSQDSIYCNLPISSEDFAKLCFAEIEHKKIKIHDLDYSEVRLYRNKIKENPDRAHSIESFIWVTSMLTSRGRLPEKTDITKKVGLKVWPNLTRCESLPHSMNIAAVFSKQPGSLLEISGWLKIEQRYIFAFYNAAFILDMFESDLSKLKKSSFSFGKNNTKENSEDRGFFGRLLNRLKS